MTTVEPPPERRSPGTERTESTTRRHVLRSTRTSRTWTAAILFTLLLVVILIFVLQNDQRISVSFLWFNGHLPLAVAMLFAAIAGALLIAIPGTGRIYQLRRIARRQQKPRQAPTEMARPGRPNTCYKEGGR
ncbi:lipopolysaccharide assembly LapA domain-containing protein [Parafrankia sp. EUN1f]|uniref:LapA family protein n=1 Tax=Parafrankia sp. EUN1f TaxID=102897 RepID=UPI0001C4710D|nr:lipopolysaccharide assembly protein LapA domain-containing protein [Parafrankia sp. EUN1f]EFC79917.1 Uncharacterized integral membrane protein-like protein [Parafrankia sp. EUN1f]